MHKILFVVTISILVLHLLGNSFFWYIIYPWFDIPMHFLGGIWVGLLGAFIFEEKLNILNLRNPWVSLAFVLGFAFLIGLSWEVFEFAAGVLPPKISPLFERNMPDMRDSLFDLLNDVLGALVASIYVWRKSK